MSDDRPEVQVIANLVVVNDAGEVLFVRRDPEDDRWWLPGGDLEPYEHPDERARKTLEELGGLEWTELRMAKVESFRGRRGWHVMFDYFVRAAGSPSPESGAAWFPLDAPPRTMHGKYELESIRRVMEIAGSPAVATGAN
jgi:ADP-ribose pyrophosphatase YjhB (NUDIX family)